MTAMTHKPVAALRFTPRLGLRAWDGLGTVLVNGLAWLLVLVYLFPMLYMVATSLKTGTQLNNIDSPPWPAQRITYPYQGEEYVVYNVPTGQGVQQWALVTPRRKFSEFIDPAHPERGLIRWEGFWGSLKAVYKFQLTLDNFLWLWNEADFLRGVGNTLFIVGVGGTATLLSSILVAYGFARFPIPAGRWLFILLIATIMLPDKVTLIPTYFMYTRVLKWIGTWLPLLVPHFCGSAVMIFLLRQNFKSIPREMEEAAILEGAGPMQLLISIILPQAIPAVFSVALLQFFYFWNETRLAGLYLSATPERYPVSFWLQQYGSYFPPSNLLQASALMVMLAPAVILFLAQRVFMRGVIITGTEK